jgi:hypothetical protein
MLYDSGDHRRTMSDTDDDSSAAPRDDEPSGAVPASKGGRLEAARPDTGDDERAFAHRLPWKWIVGGCVVVTLVLGGYWFKREAEANALRGQILRVANGDLAQIGARFTTFLDKIETLVIAEARRSEPERFVDPRLRIASLGTGQGLYLRVNAADATDPDKLAAAAQLMEGDAITRCLGVAPASARSLYALKGFLGPELVERANTTTSVMGLRVIDDELRRRMVRDLPPVANLMQSDWFLLVLQRGENRRDHPVDVYLWDLRTSRRLLAVRTRANGMLVPVRIELPGVEPGPRLPQNLRSGGANDCSIAAQVKELTGEPSTTFGASVDAFAAAVPDGGVGDGAVGGSAVGAGTEGAANDVDGGTPTAADDAVPSAP